MARRRRPEAGQANLVDQIQDALDKGLARFLITTQSKLSAANPVDTGRMARAGGSMARASRTGRPDAEDWGKPGEGHRPPIYKQPITLEGNWYLSNSVPYADRVALDPIWAKNGRRGGADWFTRDSEHPPEGCRACQFNFFFRRIK